MLASIKLKSCLAVMMVLAMAAVCMGQSNANSQPPVRIMMQAINSQAASSPMKAVTTPAVEAEEKFQWFTDFSKGLEQARQSNKYALLLFTGSDWCVYCQQLEKEILSKEKYQKFAAANIISIKLDTLKAQLNNNPHQALMQQYGATGYPTMFIIDSKGQVVTKVADEARASVQAFIDFIKQAINFKDATPEAGQGDDRKFARTVDAVFQALQYKASDPDPSDEEGDLYAAVSLGDWLTVKEYFIKNKNSELYTKLITDLSSSFNAEEKVKPLIGFDDFFAIADVAPERFNDDQIKSLAELLSAILKTGQYESALMEKLHQGTINLGGPESEANIVNRIDAAKLLMAMGKVSQIEWFLPSIEYCKEKNDIATLGLHVTYLVTKASTDRNADSLNNAWQLVQSLMLETADPQTKLALMPLILQFIPAIEDDMANAWLKERFADPQNRELSIEIFKAVGKNILDNTTSMDIKYRVRNVMFLNNCVKALVSSGGLDQWSDTLDVLAWCWLAEADITLEQLIKQKPRNNDPYAYQQPPQQKKKPVVDADILLAAAPDKSWVGLLDNDIMQKVQLTQARLNMKTGKTEQGWDNVVEISKKHPHATAIILNEYLNEWSSHVNNSPLEMNIQNPYMYRYGGGPQYTGTHGLPLTRARQKRNLADLALLRKKIDDTMPGQLNPATLVKVFADCHSAAEVYYKEDIENVFGSINNLPVDVRIELINVMRQGLMNSWGDIEIQQEGKTNRTEIETIKEVARGYGVLEKLINEDLDVPSWQFHRFRGMVMYDCAEFFYTLRDKDIPEHAYTLAQYTAKRKEALDSLEQAAMAYSLEAPQLQKNSRKVDVYLNWFYMVLGASDLAHVKRSTDLSSDYLNDIRNAILSLPGELPQEHFAAFADSINKLMPQAPENVKMRLLEASLIILGDSSSGEKARQQITYYNELLDEIQLRVRVDNPASSTDVGSTSAFGVFIELCHTQNVERENNGFARYLQNTTKGYYSYNSPKVDYRDNFKKYINDALKEKFEIYSLTFAAPEVKSREYGRPFWRVTPLAYVVIKAKDASVDQIPPIQMDMDFVDNQGNVVLPVRSAILGIDAQGGTHIAKPDDLAVTTILDTRKLKDEGIVKVDIEASARGLIPDLADMVDAGFAGYEIVDGITDEGLVVDKLDVESDKVAAVTQRSWSVELKPVSGNDKFTFPIAKKGFGDIAIVNKLYDDADVVEAKAAVVSIGKDSNILLYSIIIVAVLVIGLIVLIKSQTGKEIHVAQAHDLPADLTPFTVLSFLKHIEADTDIKVPENQTVQFNEDMQMLELAYFSPDGSGQVPDLQGVAKKWYKLIKK
ncbi:MAG: thioredoxin fold domain-containing protein [Phycisphaerae bacterium]|nr:thioredoxin fold domain-containing protein [Phycisphaerae bacterium]